MLCKNYISVFFLRKQELIFKLLQHVETIAGIKGISFSYQLQPEGFQHLSGHVEDVNLRQYDHNIFLL